MDDDQHIVERTRPGWAEADRLRALRRYDVLDTPREPAFDDIVTLAAQVCEAPLAAVSLVDTDRQWFKAEVGVNVSETPRSISFCAHAIEVGGLYVVRDAAADPLFRDNPLVTGPPGIRFYAGAVLEAPEGLPLGALCVIDLKPRPQGLREGQRSALQALGRQVVSQLELRRALAAEQAGTAALRGLVEDSRRQAQALRVIEERYHFASRAGLVGSWDWNVAEDRVFADERFAEAFGVDPALATEGAPLAAYLAGVHPEDRVWLAESIWRCTQEACDFAEEYRVVSASGEVRWLFARGRCFRDEAGRPQRFPGVAIDITERRRAEEALREANASRELAMQAARLGRFDHNPSTGRRSWDARALELFGVAAEAEPPGDLIEVVHPEDRERVAEGRARATHPDRIGTYADEFRIIRQDTREVRWLSALGRTTFENGACVRFVGVFQDITERKLAEEARHEAELLTRMAVRAGAIGLWQYRPALGRVAWDERTRELFGAGPESELSFEANVAAIHPEDRSLVLEAVASAIEGSGTFDVAFRTATPAEDGRARWLDAAGKVFRERGEALLLGALRDITAEKRAEEHQLLLTNELNHRVKNTLAIVQGLVSQTLRTVSTPEEARAAITERLAALGRAHDILTRRSWSSASVAEVVESATAPLAGAGRVVSAGPLHQLGPRAALSLAMALHELGANAVKYGALSGEAGSVEITWSLDDGGEGFRLRWRERGGPPVRRPERRGLGSRLLESALAAELGGTSVLEFDAGGVVWTLAAPAEALQAA